MSCSQIECKGFARFSARVGTLALRTSGPKRGVVRAGKVARDAAQSATVCELDRVFNIVDLKRGRCHYCQIKEKKPQHYTSFGCRVCVVYDCVRHPALRNFIIILSTNCYVYVPIVDFLHLFWHDPKFVNSFSPKSL